MGTVSDKVVWKSITRILCSIVFFSENHDIYEITWKNVVKPERSQMATRHMHFACWITKATNTLRIIHIAFAQQKWFCERASPLHYTYTASHYYFSSVQYFPQTCSICACPLVQGTKLHNHKQLVKL
jgi:hypothetical protein